MSSKNSTRLPLLAVCALALCDQTAIAGSDFFRFKSRDAFYDCVSPRSSEDKQFESCTRVIEGAHYLAEEKAAALTNRGAIYNERRQYELAIQDLASAIQSMPALTAAHLNRAHSYRELGEFDRALADYTEAIRLDPKTSIPLVGRGKTYAALGHKDLARADLSQAIALDPDDASGLHARCLLQALDGENTDAAPVNCAAKPAAPADSASTVDEFAPNDAPAEKTRKFLLKRGKTFLGKQQFDNARRDFEDVLRDNARDSEALFGRGLAKLKLGDTAGGNADIEQAKAIDPKIGETYASYGVTP